MTNTLLWALERFAFVEWVYFEEFVADPPWRSKRSRGSDWWDGWYGWIVGSRPETQTPEESFDSPGAGGP